MLINVQNLYKIYHEGLESEVRALDGVSLTLIVVNLWPSSAHPAPANPR